MMIRIFYQNICCILFFQLLPAHIFSQEQIINGVLLNEEGNTDQDISYLLHDPVHYGVIVYYKADVLKSSFSRFTDELDSFNVDLMNKSGSTISFEIAGYYNRFYGSISFGFGEIEDEDHDSLNIEFNTQRYSVHLGYNMINSKKFLITPELAFIWNRHHLINTDKDRRITLTQYMTERDLEIKINQLTMLAGLVLSYKIYKHNVISSDYWTIGIHGGYQFKLHNKPWVYSRGNRLETESMISLRNFNAGLHFSFNVENLIPD